MLPEWRWFGKVYGLGRGLGRLQVTHWWFPSRILENRKEKNCFPPVMMVPVLVSIVGQVSDVISPAV